MNTLSSAEEKRLLNAVETVISLTDKGTSPDDAMYKVAEEGKFTPPFVHRISEAYNVVRTSRTLKEAAAEKRTADFGLVDPEAVVKRLYPSGEEKTAELQPLVLPKIDCKTAPAMQKVAAAMQKQAWFVGASNETVLRSLAKCRDAHNLMNKRMATKEAALKEQLDKQLDGLLYEVRKLPKAGIQKMAQLVVNGFPSSGKAFLQLLKQRSGVDIPMADKTAEAAVFPSRAPYFQIAEVHETAARYLKANQDRAAFSKYAEGLVGDLAKVVGDVTTEGLGGLKPDKGRAADRNERIIGEELDPQFFNSLKEVGTRKSFMDLALYDPDLNQYDAPTLIGAFNSAVSSVPEASENPAVLKTLMLQRINTGGIQDTFQATQEAALGKTLRERENSSRAAAAPRPVISDVPSIKQKKDEKESPLSKLLKGTAKVTSELVKPAGAGDKDREKTLSELEKDYGGELKTDAATAEKAKEDAKTAASYAKEMLKGFSPTTLAQMQGKGEYPITEGKTALDVDRAAAKMSAGTATPEEKELVTTVLEKMHDFDNVKGKPQKNQGKA